MGESNKNMTRDTDEVTEYGRLCRQVMEDIDALLPMLDDEARALFLRIIDNHSRITEISVGESFMQGAAVAGCIMREE